MQTHDLIASSACIDLIEHFEGLRLTSYRDAGGVWTIGYGHTGNSVCAGQTITQEDADRLLVQDVTAAENVICTACAGVHLTQGQFDALVSFVFNVGPGKRGFKSGLVWLKNGKPSTLLAKVRAGDVQGAADEFPKWVYAGGKVLAGLVRRRKAERSLFLTGAWTA